MTSVFAHDETVHRWVTDRAPRLAPNLFRAIIDEGHKHGLQVNAHVFYYTDAVDLVNAGVDALVHLVRDKEMDDALAECVSHAPASDAKDGR